MRLVSLRFFFVTTFLFLGNTIWAQYTLPQKPSVLYPVYDESKILTETEKNNINEKLIKFSDSTSTEISVIIIPTTQGEDINYVAWQFGEQWKIGQKVTNNGIVLLIATEDRKISIQQGRDVEKYLTASVSGQIIDYIISPNFKKGLWYQGIDQGTTALMETVQGKYKPIAKKRKSSDEPSFIKIFFIVIILLIILSSFFGNNNNGRRNKDDDVILSRRGRRNYTGGFFPFPPLGGGFGGGSRSGGFGGFGGGGSFGGGGASGGW